MLSWLWLNRFVGFFCRLVSIRIWLRCNEFWVFCNLKLLSINKKKPGYKLLLYYRLFPTNTQLGITSIIPPFLSPLEANTLFWDACRKLNFLWTFWGVRWCKSEWLGHWSIEQLEQLETFWGKEESLRLKWDECRATLEDCSSCCCFKVPREKKWPICSMFAAECGLFL